MKSLILIIFLLPVILFSEDLGEWKHVQTLNGNFTDMDCHDSTDCWIINQSDGDQSHYLYKSSDQGRSWFQVYHLNGNNTEWPRLFQSWQAVSPHPHYYYITFANTGARDILKSSDGGHSFQRLTLGTDPLRGWDNVGWLYMFDGENGYMTTRDSVVPCNCPWVYDIYYSLFLTKNGWQSYKKIEIPEPFNKNGSRLIDISPDGRMRLIKVQNNIVSYNIFKNEWRDIGYSENYILKFIFVNETLGFGVSKQRYDDSHRGYDQIFRTTNGGKTFETLIDSLVEGNPWGLQDVAFYDENRGVAVGAHGKVWMTNNGGNDWHCWQCDRRPEVFRRQPLDSTFGPYVLNVAWAGRTPIIATRMGGHMYRYEGNFFKFKDEIPPLNAPEGIFPPDSSITHETDIQFQWSDVNAAEKYFFRLSEFPDLTNSIAGVSVTESEYTVDDLKRYTDYYWSVGSVRGDEQKWSPVYTFRTKLADVELVFPVCDSIDQERDMTIRWKAVNGAEYYRFRMSEYDDFSVLSVSEDSLKTNSIGMTGLKHATTYYWKVQAYNSVESSEWSEVCSFTVKNATSVYENDSYFRIYPNPANNTLYIDGIDQNYGIEYQISDNNGKLLLSGTLRDNGINIKSLSTGVYYISINANGVTYKDKFVKE